jgi:phage terminase large subunit-like protein
MIDNVVMEEDNMKNRKPMKKTANKKIDGVITMLMSLGQFVGWKRN